MLWSGLSLVRSGRDTAIAQPNLTYTGTHSVTTMSPFLNTGPFVVIHGSARQGSYFSRKTWEADDAEEEGVCAGPGSIPCRGRL